FRSPNIGAARKVTNSISGIGLLVPSYDSLMYWQERLDSFEVKNEGIGQYAGRDSLVFWDREGLKLILINHQGDTIPDEWSPWEGNRSEERRVGKECGYGTRREDR